MVDLGAAVVGVRREGVPDAAFGELGVAHDELAALDAVFVDVLTDDALVGGGLRAEGDDGGFLHRGDGGGMGGVSWAAQDEEPGRVFRIHAGE